MGLICSPFLLVKEGDRADQMHDLIPYAEGREQHEEDDQYFNKKSLALAAPHGREFKD